MSVFHLLKVSWFLDVPLAINALILCPTVIYRAVKSGRNGEKTKLALTAAAGMMVFSLSYLLFVFC